MKFTVTPLGGGRAETARVVDAIVRYLQPPAKGAPSRPDPSPGPGGPERYYADSGEEPGRWLGRAAEGAGLAGVVQRSDFAAVLAGRDPHTDERLISAQGSAGRRPTLGSGAHTKVGADGEQLYDVADAAAALEVSHREVEQFLDAGTAVALSALATVALPHAAPTGDAGTPARSPGAIPGRDRPPDAPPARPPVDPVTRQFTQPGGSYLLPWVESDGSRWVRASELTRCVHARESGARPGEIRGLGAPDDQLSLAEAARLVGVTNRYLRGLARYHDEHRPEIKGALAAGRHPRRAYLVAHRGTKGQWLVTRENLAEFLERRRPPSVRVGYDLTLTTEKSLGVLALLGDDTTRDAVLGSIQAGNDWALRWLEDHAAMGRVEGRQVEGEGWMVASFRHLTSRALDPFPHHHNVIANTVRLTDGTHRALDARPLYQHAQAASALATAEMRRKLTEQLGVRWRPGRKSGWEVDGITNRVVSEFSKRRNEIDDALQELEAEIGRGAHPNEIEHIVLRTRPAKNHTPADDLIASWRERAARHGLTPEVIESLTGHDRSGQVTDTEALFMSLAGPTGICAGGSVFSRSEALAAMANLPVPDTEGDKPQPLLCGARRLIELTDEFLASPHVVALTDADDPLFTTVEMLDVQDRVAARFTKGMHRASHLVPDEQVDAAIASHPHLTGEQRRLVTEWCQRGHRFQAAVGRAGAGKTTTVAACAEAWAAAGYRVVGAAAKGEATRTLATATGIECETVAWYLAHTDPHNLPLDSRTILVVDEASTLSDRDLDSLMGMASATGASLRLIGDPAQHGAIAAGGMFRVLCERHPQHTPELTTTHRLQNPHDRAAAQALREGRIDEAFDELANAGHLHVVGDDLTIYRQVLGRWWDAHRDGLDHPMVDRRNSTRLQLNRLAHVLRQANGELGDEEIRASGGRAFAAGDRITARAPNRDLHVEGDRRAYVRNGALGTVVAVHQDRRDRRDRSLDTLTVEFDGIGPIEIPRSFFDLHRTPAGRPEVGIDHAYALTSYAVQGSTRDVSTSRVDATATRAETYVDITRGRHENHLYLTATTDPLDGEALPRIPPAPADLAVADRLHRSTGELTAWELAHPAEKSVAREQAVGI
ncbi:MAG: relaxase domain-containing protein [Acidimicrobiales bacterium]|nr:relaxase domain-containing protein [Acidimicrobiales bacterium]